MALSAYASCDVINAQVPHGPGFSVAITPTLKSPSYSGASLASLGNHYRVQPVQVLGLSFGTRLAQHAPFAHH